MSVTGEKDEQIAQYCTRLAKLLGLVNSLPPDILVSTVEDETYAHNLFISRNTPEFLTPLFNNPPIQATDKKRFSGRDFRQKAGKFLDAWEKRINHQNQKQAYEQRYGSYFNRTQQQGPGTKPCKPCAELKVNDFREVYLDHNATTAIRPEVAELLIAYYQGKWGFGNPSSNTVQGDYTSDLLLAARQKIACCLAAAPEEILFTGSGSEANNLAIKGIAYRHLEQKGHLITTKVEHPSVLAVMKYLETLGFSVTYLDVDRDGIVAPASVNEAIQKNTILVSVMAANNEIGSINPLYEIGRICRERNIPFMVDAIQAFGKIPLTPRVMNISLLSFSGHKLHAPKGIGGLYAAQGITLIPQIHGGGQEAGLRSGTENVGSVLALGKAAELAYAEMAQETERLLELRTFFLEELHKIEPAFIVNGSLKHRLPNNLSIGFPGVDGSALLRSLNRIGISVSVGSACSSKKIKTSHVLEAIGADTENYATIRFGFGLRTTREDLAYLFNYLPEILPLIKARS